MALLLLFWLFGLVVGNLGQIIWVALVIAVALIIYNLLTRGTATY